MTVDNETDNVEAFDLVTEALENIDTYQQSRDPDPLVAANNLLSKAVELDHYYFKARYLQAMVTYLNSSSKDSPRESNNALYQFQQLQESSMPKSVEIELQYNLAAAHFENGNFTDAINLFEITIEEAWRDPEVQLLSRAGAALAYATRAVKGYSETRKRDKAEVEKQYRLIRRELSPLNLHQLKRQLLGHKPIDKQIERKVKEIVKHALSLVRDMPSSTPPIPA